MFGVHQKNISHREVVAASAVRFGLREKTVESHYIGFFYIGFSYIGFVFLALVVPAAAQAYVAFDSASASSVYSAGSFTAEEAIAPGSGYWCRPKCFSVLSALPRDTCVLCVCACACEVLDSIASLFRGPGPWTRDTRQWV